MFHLSTNGAAEFGPYSTSTGVTLAEWNPAKS